MLTSKQIDENEKFTEECQSDFDEYIDAIIQVRREALKQRLEEHSMRVNAIHRGTKE
jgi:hypothetical protein